MNSRPTPAEMELKLRALLDAEGLDAPDEVRPDGDDLLLLWHDRKLAVIVSPD